MENEEYQKQRKQLLKFGKADWFSLSLFIFFFGVILGATVDIVNGNMDYQNWVSFSCAVMVFIYSVVSGIFLFFKKIKKLKQLKQKYGIGD